VHLDVIKSFIRPTNAQVNCFKILKFTFIVNFNVNFNILKQFNCVLVGRIKDLIRFDLESRSTLAEKKASTGCMRK